MEGLEVPRMAPCLAWGSVTQERGTGEEEVGTSGTHDKLIETSRGTSRETSWRAES